MNTKHAWIGVLVSLALVLGFAGTSFSYGVYLDTIMGGNLPTPNADLTTFEEMIEVYAATPDDIDLEFYAKVQAGSNSQTADSNGTMTYSGTTKDGGWTTGDAISLLGVKASNGYALYWYDPAVTSGLWSTQDLLNNGGQQPDMSNMVTWTMNENPGPGPDPIPEPSTVFLMGIGLAGLGVTSYRKRQRK